MAVGHFATGYRPKILLFHCFLVKTQFFHVFDGRTTDFATCLYGKIAFFVDFAHLQLLLTFFDTCLVFILCADRMKLA